VAKKMKGLCFKERTSKRKVKRKNRFCKNKRKEKEKEKRTDRIECNKYSKKKLTCNGFQCSPPKNKRRHFCGLKRGGEPHKRATQR
jgi:hypothetical protein